jgi:hypothetical protein
MDEIRVGQLLVKSLGNRTGEVVSNPLNRESGHFHAVQFYSDEGSLARLVAGFLADGFDAGDAGVIIATPEHRVLIEAQLRHRHVDVDALKRMGELAVVDARETLQTFMVNGLPHASTFQFVLGRMLDQVCRAHPGCTIRAYGEMVNVLWRDGFEAAAIRLETLWNELAQSREFKLLCGYSMGNFYKGTALDDIRGLHSHLSDDTGVTMRQAV